MKKLPATFSFISCLLLIITTLSVGCNKIKPENPADALPVQQADAYLLQDVSVKSQLVVWKNPDSSTASFNRWMKRFIDTAKKKGGVQQMYCSCCDSTLRLLWGTGVATYIQGNTTTGGSKATASTTVTGKDGPAYVSVNFRVNRPRKLPTLGAYSYHVNPYAGKSVTAAVFDTGLDTTGGLKNFLYKSLNSSCLPGAKNGYNFVNDNSNYYDDNSEKHGTNVTRYITDQVVQLHKRSVRILPVKTNDKDGVGDLYSMLCGFAYARERGAQIINASIGFAEPRLENTYAGIDPNVQLLQEFVHHYLTEDSILLVAAAGNLDKAGVQAAFDLTGYDIYKDTPLPYPTNYRNLDQFSFYPASLSRNTERFWNVIAVTTVDTADIPNVVSSYQNFSPNVVDFGVKADGLIAPGHYVFNNPNLSAGVAATLEGSSFATPIITGKLCANYDAVLAVIHTSGFKKAQILDIIASPPAGGTAPGLKNQIRSGRYVDK